MDDDFALILATVREAGRLALAQIKLGVESWEKVPGHPVTQTDLAIDAYLKATLLAARPAYGWLSEETVDNAERLSARRVFIVDPIDGTRDMIRGRDGWAIAIAIVEDGEPVASVVFAPALGNLYAAQRGKGATLNGRPIGTRAGATLDDARLCVDRDLPRSHIWAGPPMGTVRKPNSIALRIARVASGEADATFDGRESREYDTAAATLILTEAGGIVTDLDGKPPRYNKARATEANLVASANVRLHADLRRVFGETRANWLAGRSQETG